jgi:aryl-alcohol dehydrogenase-like predicted oxidoreductase
MIVELLRQRLRPQKDLKMLCRSADAGRFSLLGFNTASFGPTVDDEHLYRLVEALEEVARQADKTVPQVALKWLTGRPTVSSVIMGARNEEQLRQNLGAVGWHLTSDQIALLDNASSVTPPYPHFPYHRQEGFARLNPPIIGSTIHKT